MNRFFAFAAIATAFSFSAASAQAGGWGSNYSHNGHNNYSSGLVNVSPSVGDVNVLNGIGILNNSPIASGNVTKGILSGNGILGGSSVLNGNSNGIGILGVGSNLLKGGKRR